MIKIPETSVLRYVSGKYALNIISPEGTGDWHRHEIIFTEGEPFMFICGQDAEFNTNAIFGSAGVNDKSEIVKRMGIEYVGDKVFIADHFRAIADLVIVLSEIKSAERVIVLDDFMHTMDEKMRVIELLSDALSKIPLNYRDKVSSWIKTNTPTDN